MHGCYHWWHQVHVFYHTVYFILHCNPEICNKRKKKVKLFVSRNVYWFSFLTVLYEWFFFFLCRKWCKSEVIEKGEECRHPFFFFFFFFKHNTYFFFLFKRGFFWKRQKVESGIMTRVIRRWRLTLHEHVNSAWSDDSELSGSLCFRWRHMRELSHTTSGTAYSGWRDRKAQSLVTCHFV